MYTARTERKRWEDALGRSFSGRAGAGVEALALRLHLLKSLQALAHHTQNPMIRLSPQMFAAACDLLLGCGPADELNDSVACAEQPGPRSAQACYAKDDARFAAAACGAFPDTTARPTDEVLATWRCRREAQLQFLARRELK